MIITKHNVTFEQFELIPQEPEPEQLSLEFEFPILSTNDLNLNYSKQNPKRRSRHANNNYN